MPRKKFKILEGQISSLIEAPGLEKPTILLDGEIKVKKIDYEAGEFSNSINPEIGYLEGSGEMNEGGGGWATTSDIEQLNKYAEAINGYNDALAVGDQSLAGYYKAQIDQISASIVPFIEATWIEGQEREKEMDEKVDFPYPYPPQSFSKRKR